LKLLLPHRSSALFASKITYLIVFRNVKLVLFLIEARMFKIEY